MNKKTSFFLSALVFTSMLSGCGDKSSELSNVDVVTTTEPVIESYVPGQVNRTSMLDVAECFIQAIQNKDFSTAVSLLDVKDNTFISPDDLEYIVRRSIIGYMVGDPSATKYNVDYRESAGTGSYSFYVDTSYNVNSIYSLSLKVNENNEWSISSIPFVKDNVEMFVPAGVRFYLNDIEVPEELKIRTENSVDIYCIPCIARRNFKTTIVSSIFDEITGELEIPAYNPLAVTNPNDIDIIEIYRKITPELFNDLGNYVTELYNSIYIMMDSEESVENLNSYIGGNKNYKWLEEYYVAGINARLSQNFGDEINYVHTKTDTEILEYWQNPAVSSYVFSNNTIVLNMVLKIRWLDDGVAQSEMICAGVKLTKEPGGSWLINDITPGAWTVLQDGLDESQGVDAW